MGLVQGVVLWGLLYFLCFFPRYFLFFFSLPLPCSVFVGKNDVIRTCDWWCYAGGLYAWMVNTKPEK